MNERRTEPRRKPTSVKKKRNREATKQALFQAAVRVFAQRGYDAATTREVAEEAGVSEGLIHRYFEGKEGLLFAILNNFPREVDCGAEALPLADSVGEEIAQIIQHSCKMHEENDKFMRVAISRAIVDARVGKQVGSLILDYRLALLEARLKHFQKLGEIGSGEDLKALALVLSGLTFAIGFMTTEVFCFDRKRMQAVSEYAARVVAQGIQKETKGNKKVQREGSP